MNTPSVWDVFERPASFDPGIDSTVRAEVSRFRAKLKEYYAGQGSKDAVCIDLGPRGYVAIITFRDPESPDTVAALETAFTLHPSRRRKSKAPNYSGAGLLAGFFHGPASKGTNY